MWLCNLNIRVKEYPKGWVIETQKQKWWGKKYWIHIISVSGMEDEPWYYSTKEIAIECAVKYFEWDLLINSR